MRLREDYPALGDDGPLPAGWIDNGDGTLTAPDGSGGWVENPDGTFTASLVDGLGNTIVFTVDAAMRPLQTLRIPPSGASPVTGPDTVAFDPTHSYASARAPGENLDNGGCPIGYFAQYVAPNGTDYQPPGKDYALRCRLIATSTAQTIRQESPVPLWAQAAINFDQAAKAAGAAIKRGLQVTVPWLVAAGAAALLVLRGRK